VSLYFPLIEFRQAALWFAQQGYVVVAPIRSGYGITGIEIAERGIFNVFFSAVGRCSDPQFRDAGLAVAAMDGWVIDYMTRQPFVERDKVIIVGQSGGGWGAIALGSQNPASVRAIIAFAAGRGGHVDGKPNNNCPPIDWSKRPLSLGERRALQCCGYIPKTTCTLAPRCLNAWPAPSRRRAEMLNIICCHRLDTTVIFWSTRRTGLAYGHRWSTIS
jgi:pimeloyl-ACP methyl ester carboxylesterase